MLCATQYGRTPLIDAIKCGHLDVAKVLLGHKADVNIRDNVTGGEGWGVAPIVFGADACIVGVFLLLRLWCCSVEFRIWVSESDVNVSVAII